MHVNIIKGALWSPETEEVFYVFDLKARNMSTWAPILNCGFQMYFILTLYLKKEIAFAFVSKEPGKIKPFTFKHGTTASAN